jgi:hypothetical protein
MNQRKELARTFAVQQEVAQADALATGAGRPRTPEDFQNATQRVQQDPSRLVRNTQAAIHGVFEGLGKTVGMPFLAAIALTEGAMDQFGAAEAYRNLHRDFTIAWHLMWSKDKEASKNYIATLRSSIESGIGSEEMKRQQLNDAFNMGAQFREHALRARGHRVDDPEGFLEISNFFARELLGVAGDITARLPDMTVMAVAPFATRALLRPRMKGRMAVIGEVVRKAESLETPHARAAFVNKAHKVVNDLKKEFTTKKQQKSLTRMHDAVRRLEEGEFAQRGARHPQVRQRLRDFKRSLREAPTDFIERAYEVVHPDKQPRMAKVDAVDADLDLVNRAASGENARTRPGSDVTQVELDLIRDGSPANVRKIQGLQKEAIARGRAQRAVDTATRAYNRLEASRKKIHKQAATESVRAVQLVEGIEDIRALAKDASTRNLSMAAENAIGTQRRVANLGALNDVLETSLRMLESKQTDLAAKLADPALTVGRRSLFEKQLIEINKNTAKVRATSNALGRTYADLGIRRPKGKMGEPQIVGDFNIKASAKEILRAHDAIIKLRRQAEGLQLERAMIDDMLAPKRLEAGAVISEPQAQLLRRSGELKHTVPATNLPEAARRALDINDKFVPDFPPRPAVKIPRGIDELARELSRSTFDRWRTRLTTEKALLESGAVEWRLSEMAELPYHEKLRVLRGSVRQKEIVESAAGAHVHFLTEMMEQLEVPHGKGIINKLNPLARKKAASERQVARTEIFEALSSKDPELLRSVYEKYGDALEFRDKILSEYHVLGRKFGIIKEAEFEKMYGKAHVTYLYNNLQFREAKPWRTVRGHPDLTVDPTVLRHRLPENSDLLVYTEPTGKQTARGFKSIEAAEDWANKFIPGQPASIIRRWSRDARTLHGLIKDPRAGDAVIAREMSTAIGNRMITEALRGTKLVKDVSEVKNLPPEIRKNYVSIGRAKDRNPIFEPLEGSPANPRDLVVHRDALWEVARFGDEMEGMFNVLGSFSEFARQFEPLRDLEGGSKAFFSELDLRARRVGSQMLRSVPVLSKKSKGGRALLSTWKLMKIPLSYPVGFVNYTSNFILGYWAGHPMTPRGAFRYALNSRRFVDMIKNPAAATKDPIFRAMMENGKLDVGLAEVGKIKGRQMRGWETAENKMRMLDEAEIIRARAELEGDTSLMTKAEKRIEDLRFEVGELTKPTHALINSTLDIAGRISEKASRRYNLLDTSAQYAVTKHLVDVEGMTVEAAIQKVNTFMQNYTMVSGGVRRAGRSPFTPVPAFVANVFRILGNNITQQPMRFLKPFMAAFAWNQGAMATQGVTPEEMLSELDARRKWRHTGSIWDTVDLMTNVMIPIPGVQGSTMLRADELATLGMFNGQHFAARKLLDMMSEEQKRNPVAQGLLRAVGAPASAIINGPAFQLFDVLANGFDPGLNRSVDAADAGFLENAWRRVEAFARNVLPAGLPPTFQFEQVSEAIRGKPQGITGKPRDPLLSVLNITGLPGRAWTNDQLSSWVVFQNAEEDGKLQFINIKENIAQRELREKFPELSEVEQIREVSKLITREGRNAAGEKVKIVPRQLPSRIEQTIENFQKIGRARHFKNLSIVAKTRAIADHYKIALPPELLGPLVGEWLTANEVRAWTEDPTSIQALKSLREVVPGDYLRRAIRAAAEYQANFAGKRE